MGIFGKSPTVDPKEQVSENVYNCVVFYQTKLFDILYR